MDTKHDVKNIKLTTSEISQLWATYMSNSMTHCVASYFERITKQPEIKTLLKDILNIISGNFKIITDIFNTENHPIPNGFNEKDVNTNAKALFSDTFIAQYIKFGTKYALISYANALTIATRSDVRKFFTDRVISATNLTNRIDDIMLEKGIYIKPPLIPVQEKVEFVEQQSFMKGLFSPKRPLNAMEIANIYANIETNALGRALVTGFAQTASSHRVKKFMVTGKDIATDHIEMFSNILKESDVCVPSSWDSEVMESNDPTFSDKLMMFHISALSAFSINSYGFGIANSMRSDVALAFTKLMAEIARYAKDGAEIMIDNTWLEEIPEAANRRELINV